MNESNRGCRTMNENEIVRFINFQSWDYHAIKHTCHRGLSKPDPGLTRQWNACTNLISMGSYMCTCVPHAEDGGLLEPAFQQQCDSEQSVGENHSWKLHLGGLRLPSFDVPEKDSFGSTDDSQLFWIKLEAQSTHQREVLITPGWLSSVTQFHLLLKTMIAYDSGSAH